MIEKEIMTLIDEFVNHLLKGKGATEKNTDFIKYYNDKFEVIVFDNKVIVKDKRHIKKTVIYNNLNIARARLINV